VEQSGDDNEIPALAGEKAMTVVKPNLGPHAERSHNPLDFDEAYNHVLAGPAREYHTRGTVSFGASASIVTKGKHRGDRVLVFKSSGKERAGAIGQTAIRLTSTSISESLS
jgi:hypothetical protein